MTSADSNESRLPRPHRVRDSGSSSTQRGRLVWPLIAGITGALVIYERLVGIPLVSPFIQLIAFYPLLSVCWIGLAVWGLFKRKWLLVAVATVVVAGILSTSWPPSAPTAAPREAIGIRVVASNVYVGEGAQGLVRQLAAEQVPVDLLLVSECNEECAAVLTSAAMESMFPYRHMDAQPGARGAAILSRTPLANFSQIVRPVVRDGPISMPSATTIIGSQQVAVKVAHPFPPVPLETSQWRAGLAELEDFASGTSGPLIIGGDFNATVYHRPFREILDQGLYDALSPRVGTWPQGLPSQVAAPIDHILVRSPIAVVASGAWDVEGSDHRTVWADLLMPTS